MREPWERAGRCENSVVEPKSSVLIVGSDRSSIQILLISFHTKKIGNKYWPASSPVKDQVQDWLVFANDVHKSLKLAPCIIQVYKCLYMPETLPQGTACVSDEVCRDEWKSQRIPTYALDLAWSKELWCAESNSQATLPSPPRGNDRILHILRTTSDSYRLRVLSQLFSSRTQSIHPRLHVRSDGILADPSPTRRLISCPEYRLSQIHLRRMCSWSGIA